MGTRVGSGERERKAMVIIWVRTDGRTDPAVTGEMKRSGHVQNVFCRRHQQAWKVE